MLLGSMLIGISLFWLYRYARLLWRTRDLIYMDYRIALVALGGVLFQILLIVIGLLSIAGGK